MGNANLCHSCHVPGGKASAKLVPDREQALPWPGLPTNLAGRGTTHRWDSGPAGHVAFAGSAPRPSGTVESGGAYTGRVAKTYALTIAQAGEAGSATFDWTALKPGGGGSGSNLVCDVAVPLDEGVTVTFKNGGVAPSFRAGDQWNIYVRADLQMPTNALLLANMSNGMLSCSTCHDPHSQARQPFGTNAPAYAGPGTGSGRRFMRVDNNACQMCVDCHAARNVTNAVFGSHPVGNPILTNSVYRLPSTNLPLEALTGNVQCMTCHDIHGSATRDGELLRITNRLALCVDCHRLADTNTPAAHLSRTNWLTLWPGGQYGSSFPARTNAGDRGTCVNCHYAHGWPNPTNAAAACPMLLLDLEENLCYTCHDTNGPAARAVRDELSKPVRHPIGAADPLRRPGRAAECSDCHNTHRALSGAYVYANTATTNRNLISNPLKGASGVDVNYAGLGNFEAPTINLYSNIPTSVGITKEYQLCFKCHSGYAWLPGGPPNGLSPNGSATNPVETDLAQEFSPKNRSGHPIVTGLDNYTNSIVVGGKRGLQASMMKPPWNVNVGKQTMRCSDCHNTDLVSPAAQGPHGSAVRYMLRGANPNNWPNQTGTVGMTNSWCLNCHVFNTTTANHNNRHRAYKCYECHIVIPHGGKISRLMGDRTNMPARYAYSGVLTNMMMISFTKTNATSTSYKIFYCEANCDISTAFRQWSVGRRLCASGRVNGSAGQRALALTSSTSARARGSRRYADPRPS
jgi:predicted CXXCH cytochrome family protein